MTFDSEPTQRSLEEPSPEDLARTETSAREIFGALLSSSEFAELLGFIRTAPGFTTGDGGNTLERKIRDTGAQWLLQVEPVDKRSRLLHHLFTPVARRVVSHTIPDRQYDVDEVVNTAIFEFLEKWVISGNYDSATSLVACIAKRRALDYLRSAWRRNKRFIQVADPELYQPRTDWCNRLPEVELEDVLDLLKSCIGELQGVDRQLIDLHYTERQTSEEIGALIGLTPPAVRQRIHRIRSRLRDCISRKSENRRSK